MFHRLLIPTVPSTLKANNFIANVMFMVGNVPCMQLSGGYFNGLVGWGGGLHLSLKPHGVEIAKVSW